jgi:hypothetical protein
MPEREVGKKRNSGMAKERMTGRAPVNSTLRSKTRLSTAERCFTQTKTTQPLSVQTSATKMALKVVAES